MDKRWFRVVIKNMIKSVSLKLSKFNLVFSISLIRIFLFLIEKLSIQRYVSNEYKLVDYFVRINPLKLLSSMKILAQSLFLSYEQLINLVCVDNLNLKKYNLTNRFSLIYILNKISSCSRLVIYFDFNETKLIPSVTPVFKDANWLEREIFDLYGIFFVNHRDLRRILTDYGFRGFPLRKDFPLTGYLELRYSEVRKYVKYQRLVLMQEYRYFNFTSPWKQYTEIKSMNFFKHL